MFVMMFTSNRLLYWVLCITDMHHASGVFLANHLKPPFFHREGDSSVSTLPPLRHRLVCYHWTGWCDSRLYLPAMGTLEVVARDMDWWKIGSSGLDMGRLGSLELLALVIIGVLRVLELGWAFLIC